MTFVLYFGPRPELSGSLVHGSCEGQDRFVTISDLVIHIDTADHGRFVKEGHITDSPWFSADLSTDLDQNLAADASHILATGDSVR